MDRPVTTFCTCTCHLSLGLDVRYTYLLYSFFVIPQITSRRVDVSHFSDRNLNDHEYQLLISRSWDDFYAHVWRKEGCLSLHLPSIMALRDQLWPCEIIFGLAEIDYGLARSIMTLRDQLWPCKIDYGLARLIMALRDRLWPCQTADGLTRWPIALWKGPLLCEAIDGLARSFMALLDHLWPCKKTHGCHQKQMTVVFCMN